MSCEKDSLYMANSVNNGQNALDGMFGSKLALYAQENCHLLHSLSNTEFKGSDDMAKENPDQTFLKESLICAVTICHHNITFENNLSCLRK